MSVLVFAESAEGRIIKTGLEAIGYGAQTARHLNTNLIVLANGPLNGDGGAGTAGATEVLVADNIHMSDSGQVSKAIATAAKEHNADVIVLSHDHTGKLVGARVAAAMKAGMVAGAIALPDTANGFVVKKNVFSGKAFAKVKVNSAIKVVSVLPNSLGAPKGEGTASISAFTGDFGSAAVSVKEVVKEQTGGMAPLPEAEVVVSAGRGLKGPENWGMIEELAKELGATTACSRPVADIGWRPHHEHVGQTGVAIRPNLYIAVGISGAIQHLAGVNGSKVIVVVNTDKEAPFFKAADYGIVGDAFEVVPKLVEAVKQYNATK
jgi:electron transfer flavoprotein alpha subunit